MAWAAVVCNSQLAVVVQSKSKYGISGGGHVSSCLLCAASNTTHATIAIGSGSSAISAARGDPVQGEVEARNTWAKEAEANAAAAPGYVKLGVVRGQRRV